MDTLRHPLSHQIEETRLSRPRTAMLRTLSFLLSLPLILVACTALLLAANLEPAPLVVGQPRPDRQDVERVRQLLKGQDPRSLPPGSDATLTIGQRDLDLAVSYLSGLHSGAEARVHLEAGSLLGEATWRVPDNPVNPYLNLALRIDAGQDEPRLTQLRVGRLELPLDMDARLLGALLLRLFRREEIPLIHSRLRSLHIEPERMVLVYRWDPELLEQAGSLAMTPEDRARVTGYYRRLGEILAQRPKTLDDLLPPLFRTVQARSAKGALTENRAALVALGLYALGRGANTVLTGKGVKSPPVRTWVRLQGREDLARHYLVSAAVAASSDSGLADLMGLYKEWKDSQGGSGFSFVDLAADRAGTRLGTLATTSEGLARRMQRLLAGEVEDGFLLPPVTDLPEGLQEQRLERDFGGIGTPRYERMTAEIERRLNAMPLYRQR